MRTATRRSTSLAVVLVVLLGSLAGVVLADENTIEVTVSPNVLNLQSKGGSLSLHTDLAYSLAEAVVLTVDGVEVPEITTFADDCGDLVVKADLDEVKLMVSEGEATFELTVETANGTYVGSDTIQVISRSGEGQEDPPKTRVMTLIRNMVQNRRNH